MNFPRASGRFLSWRYNQSLELPHKFGHLRRDLLLNSRRRTHGGGGGGSRDLLAKAWCTVFMIRNYSQNCAAPCPTPQPAVAQWPVADSGRRCKIMWGQLQRGRPGFFTLPLRHCPKICHKILSQRQTPAPVINTLFHLLKSVFKQLPTMS